MLWPMSTQVVERIGSLNEAGDRIAAREGTGDRYRMRIMGWDKGATVAEGSSADYPVDVIKRDFREAFPPGTRMRANHDGLCEAGGDIRRVMAKTISDVEFEEDGAYADFQVSAQWNDYFREYADVIGVSVSVAALLAEVDESADDYDPDNPPKRVVERFLSQEDSPYNSIDFVEAPGARGRIVAALESARTKFEGLNLREAATFASKRIEAHKASEAVPPRNIKEGIAMDKDELQTMLSEGLAALETRMVERLAPAPATPEEIRFEQVAEAAVEAGLTKGSRAAVYERVRSGQKVDEAIAAETAREAEVKEALKADFEQSHGGYAVGEGAASASAVDEFDAIYEGAK